MAEAWLRRRFLQLGMSGIGIGLAGCQSSEKTESPTVSNIGAAPAPSCPNGYQPLDPFYVVESSRPMDGFDLTLNKETYSVGETLVAELVNVTDETRSTGVKRKFDIQYAAANGYHSIFGIPEDEDPIWPKVGIRHPPDEGFTWELPLSYEGLSEGQIESAPSLQACQQIKPGQYRFVFWGITTPRERSGGKEGGFGVPFTVLED